jgi:hypothetical protein
LIVPYPWRDRSARARRISYVSGVMSTGPPASPVHTALPDDYYIDHLYICGIGIVKSAAKLENAGRDEVVLDYHDRAARSLRRVADPGGGD